LRLARGAGHFFTGPQMNQDTVRDLDALIGDTSAVALVMRDTLMPVAGDGAVIFPPVFLDGDYSESRLPDGRSLFVIDTMAAQTNRIEAQMESDERLRALIPDIAISAATAAPERIGGRSFRIRRTSINRAPHRLADALVRFSGLGEEARDAFLAFDAGNALPVAGLDPLSLVFGAWDVDGTGVRIPRALRARIDAVDASRLACLWRPAPPRGVEEPAAGAAPGCAEQPQANGAAEAGCRTGIVVRGGIVCRGPIVREMVLDLTTVRANARATASRSDLLRYVFGLGLCGFLAPAEPSLRQGCQLVQDRAVPTECITRMRDGSTEEFAHSLDHAIEYARRGCEALGVDVKTARRLEFDSLQAQRALGRMAGAGPVQQPAPARSNGHAPTFMLTNDIAEIGAGGAASTS